MPSSYTTRLRLELQATGENRTTWGSNANNVFSRLDEAIAGRISIAMANANVTLTASNGIADQARYMNIAFTGANTAIRTVTIPGVSKNYIVTNGTTGGFAITVKTAAGTGVNIAAGSSGFVFCDGTNCFRSFDNDVTTFGGNNAAFYLNADNINAGTLALANGGTGASTAATARTALGLGAVATQNIVPIANGGTDADDAAEARANLGTDNAANLTNGTLPSARMVGAYSFASLALTGNATAAQFAPTAGEGVRLNAASDPYISFYAAGVRQGYIQKRDGTASGDGFVIYNDITDDYILLHNTNSVDALKFYDNSTASYNVVFHSGNFASVDVTTALGFTPAPNTTDIIAGNGLTGGGAISADRTMALGTPSSITNSTGNTLTADSHTHALATTFAEVYTGSTANELNFPLGHTIIISYDAGGPARNANDSVYLSGTHSYSFDVSGTALTGTWRSRGYVGGSGQDSTLMQRVS